MKRIYFVVSRGSYPGGAIVSRREFLVTGSITRQMDKVEDFIQEHSEELGRPLNGPPVISWFKCVGVVIFGRQWRWS